ncbi:MAG: LysM peptidoglycan-binding domain-containing protein [Caldilineaceae bacterium]
MLLVGFLLLSLQRWNGQATLQWAGAQLQTGRDLLAAWGEQLDPQITVRTIPDNSTSLAANPVAVNPVAVVAALPNTIESNSNIAGVAEESATNLASTAETNLDESNLGATTFVLQNAPKPAIEPTVTPLATATAVATAVATATPQPSATDQPPTGTAVSNSGSGIEVQTTPTSVIAGLTTSTPTAVAKLQPTTSTTSVAASTALTATATKASSSGSGEPLVQRNDTPTPGTVSSAARQSATTAITPTVANTATAGALSVLQPTATFTPLATIPVATNTPVPPPPTATATPAPVVTYKVQAGDTPLGIAGRFDVGVQELLAVNNMTVDDARRMRVGQELIIPGDEQPAPVAQTPTATAVSTGAAATPTAVPPSSATSTPASPIRLDAPQLRSPENGTFLSCSGENSLIWLPVAFIREDDRFLLHLGFLNGYNTDGGEEIVWVLEQVQPANATIWRMDEGLCGLAPQDHGRQWRWYVEVVDLTGGTVQPVSLPSPIWTFSWN